MNYKFIKDPFTGLPSEKMIMVIKEDGTKSIVPFDDGNADYKIFKEWIEQGNSPTQE